MCKKSSELLDVFCLLSEPPDIRNWFSSYEYESPASDTLNDFGCSSFKGSQCEKEELDTEESNRVKDENLGEFGNTELIDELASGEKTGPNAFVECKRDDKLENPYVNERNHDSEGNKDRYSWNDLCSSKISDQGWADGTLQNNEDSLPELEGKFSLKCSKTNKGIGKKGRRSPIKLVQRKGFIQRNSEANSPTKGVGPVSSECASDRIVVNGDSRKRTSLVSNDKENGGKELAENGFVSTRKNRCRGENDHNHLNKPQEFQLVRSRNTGMVLSTGEKNVGVRRKVLSEKTNLQHSDVTEIAGKWKCPQKSKPDLGPPLKQLRLEQWVHRL